MSKQNRILFVFKFYCMCRLCLGRMEEGNAGFQPENTVGQIV